MGGFAVTSGLNLESILDDFPNDDFSQIMIKALQIALPKPLPSMHEKVRQDFWGYAADEDGIKRR